MPAGAHWSWQNEILRSGACTDAVVFGPFGSVRILLCKQSVRDLSNQQFVEAGSNLIFQQRTYLLTKPTAYSSCNGLEPHSDQTLG